jgi:hypothetical protein
VALKIYLRMKLFPVLSLSVWMWAETATAQTGGFTYQGRLLGGGQPANGTYDFQFRLTGSPTNGDYRGATLTKVPLLVSNGLFITVLDFGSGVLDGSACWLEIGVRTNTSQNPYTILAPRQPITAAPYATFASVSSTASLATALADGGASLTNISGVQIQSGSISSNQLSPALDAAYRATDTNAIYAFLKMTNPISVINVKDFGAVGDGITDDTIALSNAWNSLTTQGGILYLPPGVYLDAGTHVNGGWIDPGRLAGAGQYRDGRLVWGGGSVTWRYTGPSRLFLLTNSAPDFDGIWFDGLGTTASNCMYVSTLWNKWSMRNCFFANWANTKVGTLVCDDADSITLSQTHFLRCNIGLGLGFDCSNFKGDIRGDWCGTLVAAGVPTDLHVGDVASTGVDLNVDSVYCDTAVAINAGTAMSLRIFSWYNTSGVLWIGAISGIATNYEGIGSITLRNSWFNHGSTSSQSPILLWQNPGRVLRLENNEIDFSGPSPNPVIKSLTPSGDLAKIDWQGSLALKLDNFSALAPMFQDSSGVNFPDLSTVQNVSFNRGLDIYNKANWTDGTIGGGYLLDVIDGVYPGGNSGIARLGHSWGPGDLADFWGGLTVSYDSGLDAPVVDATNAILRVTGDRNSSTPLGGVRVSDTVNATNGFMIGNVKILAGTGSPEGLVTAPVGSLFLRTDDTNGTALYVKSSGNGNTGWSAK